MLLEACFIRFTSNMKMWYNEDGVAYNCNKL